MCYNVFFFFTPFSSLVWLEKPRKEHWKYMERTCVIPVCITCCTGHCMYSVSFNLIGQALLPSSLKGNSSSGKQRTLLKILPAVNSQAGVETRSVCSQITVFKQVWGIERKIAKLGTLTHTQRCLIFLLLFLWNGRLKVYIYFYH